MATTQTQPVPEDVPTQVQLPGGILLKALPFKITAYNADDTPKLFELQPRNATELSCTLFAREDVMRRAWPGGRPPREQGPYKGPKIIPTKLQLRGGIFLKGLPFKIVEYDNGVPKLFELQAPGTTFSLTQPNTCLLFAREDWIRSLVPGKGNGV